MLRHIQIEYVAHERLEHPRHPRLRVGLSPVFAEAIIFQEGDHVFISRDQPSVALVGQLRPINGCFGPQASVERKRIRLEPRTRNVYFNDWIHRSTQSSTKERTRSLFLPCRHTAGWESCCPQEPATEQRKKLF